MTQSGGFCFSSLSSLKPITTIAPTLIDLSVHASPVSRLAAVLIILLGVFTLVLVETFAGLVIIALGIFLYWLLYRFSARLKREITGEPRKR